MTDVQGAFPQEEEKPAPTLRTWVDELFVFIESVVRHGEYLLAAAGSSGQMPEFQACTGDLEKILHAGQQLRYLILENFEARLEAGDEDLSFLTSTLRHDLRTPVNAIIGYSEMVLEDLEILDGSGALLPPLREIQNAGQRLLSMINELIYLAQKGGEQQTAAQPGEKLRQHCLSASAIMEQRSPMVVSAMPTATEEAKTASPDLLQWVKELRVSLDVVTTQSARIQGQLDDIDACALEDADAFAADMGKIQHAGAQLDTMVCENFEARLKHTGDTHDLSFLTPTLRHDLRTPVNAILGYSEMLLEDLEMSGESSDFVSALRDILNAGQRLLNDINDLIHFAQAREAGAGGEVKSAKAPAAGVLSAAAILEQSTPVVASALSPHMQGLLLVVDDKESNRELLSRQLGRHGFQVHLAENGVQALEMIRVTDYDVILLDIIMPEMDGYQVLAHLRADEKLQHTPVIMISALDEIDIVVRCIEMGAHDYLQKPFNPVILNAKIASHLERKRLRDREQAYLKQLQQEQENSEKLLLNILPKPIADRLKQGERTIADSFTEVTILFADLVDFTPLSKEISPVELIEKLNEIFFAFDILSELYEVEKIKTIGDAYMLVGGLPNPRPDHAAAVAESALDMLDAIKRINHQSSSDLRIRIGIHTGPVVAGVIGKHKFNYDLWGDAVNIASRMESHSQPGHIQVSADTYTHLAGKFELEKRGTVDIKGLGAMLTYWLTGRK